MSDPDLPADGAWVATVWADRDYHDLVRSRRLPGAAGDEAVDFPPDHRSWEVPLRGDEVRIGRRGQDPPTGDRATLVPEIDLAGPPRDPGVSHLHAVLLALPDGRWVVIDVGSTNGTTVNYAEDPLVPDAPRPVRSGDRLHLGAWTTITVHRR